MTWALSTPEDTELVITEASLLANDVDVDMDDLSIAAFTQPASGMVASDGAGNLTFTPGEDFNGTVTFDYTVTDGNATDIATVTIDVTAVNDPAVITGDTTGEIAEDQAPNAVTGDLLSTDVDNNDDVWNVVPANTPSIGGFGTVAIAADGSWTYTLNNGDSMVDGLNDGETLTDTFTATTEDGTTQTVTVTINGANDAAMISGDTTDMVDENVPSDMASGNLNSTDVDDDDDVWQEVATGTDSIGGFGTFSVGTDGAWTYTLDDTNSDVDELNVNDTLTDTFTATTTDGTTQTVTITINGANDAAVVTGDTSGTATEAGVMAGSNASGDLDHTDVDNTDNVWQEELTPTASVGGLGTFTIDSDGQWEYILNDTMALDMLNVNDTLTDTFVAMTEDGTTQVVTITIQGVDDAAMITGVTTGSVTEDEVPPSTATGNLDSTDIDNTDDAWQVVTGDASDNGFGTFDVTADGIWTFTLDDTNPMVDSLNLGDTLTETFTVTTEGGTTETVTITINGADNSPPTAVDDTDSTDENTDLTVDVLANDTDPTAMIIPPRSRWIR